MSVFEEYDQTGDAESLHRDFVQLVWDLRTQFASREARFKRWLKPLVFLLKLPYVSTILGGCCLLLYSMCNFVYNIFGILLALLRLVFWSILWIPSKIIVYYYMFLLRFVRRFAPKHAKLSTKFALLATSCGGCMVYIIFPVRGFRYYF